MPTLVLKLFSGKGTGRAEGRKDGESGDYMLLPLGNIKMNM